MDQNQLAQALAERDRAERRRQSRRAVFIVLFLIPVGVIAGIFLLKFLQTGSFV